MNRYLRVLILNFLLVITPVIAFSSNNNSLSLKTNFFQIKDEFNYGLVYSGVNLGGEYQYFIEKDKNFYSSSSELGFGVDFNKGVGLNLMIKPYDVYYGWKIDVEDVEVIALGLYTSANFNWQLYPHLQSGHMFWYTTFEAGPKAIVTLPVFSKNFRISLSNSLLGVYSRPEPSTETYYYSLGFMDFVENAFSDLEFGLANELYHINLEIEMLPKASDRLSFAYEFDYISLNGEPSLDFLSHSINLKWKLGTIDED